MEPGCLAPGNRVAIGHKAGRDDLEFRFCSGHLMRSTLGLIVLGLEDEVTYP